MMALPPSLAGADQPRSIRRMPRAALSAVGAPGVVKGVTAAEAVEASEAPTPFVATTVKVYGVPLSRPVTVALVAETVAVAPPGAAVTVYVAMAEPPSLAG